MNTPLKESLRLQNNSVDATCDRVLGPYFKELESFGHEWIPPTQFLIRQSEIVDVPLRRWQNVRE